MQFAFRMSLSLGLVLLAGCSSNNIKRNAYQSLQIIQQRKCQQHPGKDCPAAESYDKYQQQRNEAIGK